MSAPATATNGTNEKGYAGGSAVNRAVTPGGHPLDQSQPAFPVYHRRFANPAPLGLSAFAATTFVLSLINVNARGVTVPNLIVGLALGYGGLVQLLAGMWEFAAGNTFGATAFSSYGGFWLSFAAIYIPNSGILAAYTDTPEHLAMLDNAVGFYLAAWFIFTFIMLIASLRSSIGLISVFFFLDITFILLMAGNFSGKANVLKAGGGFGIVTAFCAWYVALAGLLTPDTSFFVIPVGDVGKRD